jgi:hypothetical protein
VRTIEYPVSESWGNSDASILGSLLGVAGSLFNWIWIFSKVVQVFQVIGSVSGPVGCPIGSQGNFLDNSEEGSIMAVMILLRPYRLIPVLSALSAGFLDWSSLDLSMPSYGFLEVYT